MTITTEKLRTLRDNYAEALTEYPDGEVAKHINLTPLFDSLEQYVDLGEAALKAKGISAKAITDLIAYLNKIIKKINGEADAESDESIILDEGKELVKALDKNNPLSARAKKYLGLGIAATVFGVLLIPALIIAGIYLAPLTAFSVTYTTGIIFITTQTIAVPVWALTLGIASIISMVGSIAALAKLGFGNLSPTMSALCSTELIALPAFVLIVAAGVCLMPFIPLISGVLMLKKANQLSEAPQGLALALANAIPALTKEVHYGDIEETASRKLKKAEQKLAVLNARAKKPMNACTRNDVTTAMIYYRERLTYLKDGVRLLNGGSKATLSDPNKKIRGKMNQSNYRDFKPSKESVLKNDTNNMGITVNDNSARARLSFFDGAYNHVQHAQKVEATLREHKTLTR